MRKGLSAIYPFISDRKRGFSTELTRKRAYLVGLCQYYRNTSTLVSSRVKSQGWKSQFSTEVLC